MIIYSNNFDIWILFILYINYNACQLNCKNPIIDL